jgi:hypothetical protein
MHEGPIITDDSSPDTGLVFDPMQSIIDFYRCLHGVDWVSWKYPEFLNQNGQIQEQIASEVFWTYVTVRKDGSSIENVPRHAQPLKCRSKWCYEYQGNIYQYNNVPK